MYKYFLLFHQGLNAINFFGIIKFLCSVHSCQISLLNAKCLALPVEYHRRTTKLSCHVLYNNSKNKRSTLFEWKNMKKAYTINIF